MATAADSSSTNHHSPRPDFDAGGANRRPTPWAKVVRGDSESSPSIIPNQQSPLSPPPSSSLPEQNPSSNCSPSKAAAARSSPSPPPSADVSIAAAAAESADGHNGNAARGKKPAWNKPSKDVLEVGPVMGAVAWPALSESARASPKLPADSSPKTVTDVSVPLPVSPGPVVTPSPNSKKHHGNSGNTNPASSHAMGARQRPTKRGGGSSTGGVNAHAHVHSGFAHPPPPPPPPPFPVFPLPNGYGALVPAMPDPSPRDPSFRGSNWDARPIGFRPPTHQVNDQRNSSRRGNFSPHPRGDGSYQNNFGSKRDAQDRGSFMNGRDAQMHQQQRPPPRGLVRPIPPSSAAFTPQPVRPFANPMGFPEFVYLPTLPLDPIRMPFIPHAPHPAMFMSVPEASMPSLPSLIVNQIDYYFSDTNLIRDEYLRSNMDAQGWVPISLIANFPRVKSLTTNVQLIMESLRASGVVEVQDDKLRRRSDWTKWISTTGRPASASGSSSNDVQSSDMLSNSFQKMTVDDAASTSESSMAGNSDANSKATPQKFSTESTGVSQLPNGDITQQ
ncbi:la-related protein 1C-like [Argentina anserina]|uniref:la-related protein 1C-like n=1 Tax=Argentina anserina TaxID=57926 RepID=UPI00217641C2|nr:la-related protein 1C-like [Potentilla anserina]